VLFSGGATVEGSGGSPEVIPKLIELDVPPPGAGLNTVTNAVPGWAIKLDGTAADSCVALPKLATKSVLPSLTTELPPLPLMKFVPVTVNVNEGLPAVTEV
jgi:hypothetical protein